MKPLLPGTNATLGVMGGGQLGRMFVHAAQSLGYRTAVLDPDAQSPAGLVSHLHIQTDYNDPKGLAELAVACNAITTEFENVPADAMKMLATKRPVAPDSSCLAIAQDRALEKAQFAACAHISGVQPAPYAVIDSEQSLASVPATLLPGILKTARMGYDGKGQVRVNTAQELAQAWRDLKQVPCVLEKRLQLQSECSVIVARGWSGEMVSFAPQLNIHVDGILAQTHAYEQNMPQAIADQASNAAKSIANRINYVGVLCVEFFVVDGQLVVNEMAPRPHNSGHHTIDAYDFSQFDLQVRAMAGLPLPRPRQHSAAIMLNLLGDVWLGETPPDWARVMALPGVHLHLYGKQQARAGRKMGHLTITGASATQVQAVAAEVASIITLPSVST